MKKFTRLFATTLLVLGTVQSQLPGYEYTDYTWTSYGGHEYAVSFDHNSWGGAEGEAVAVGGHLATVNDALENTFIMNLASDAYTRNNYGQHGYNGAWIGLTGHTDISGSPLGDLQWVDGTPVDYTNISPSGVDDTGMYWYMHGPNHPTAGTWNKNPVHNETSNDLRGVIERDLAPDPFPTIETHSLSKPAESHARKAIVLVHGNNDDPSLFSSDVPGESVPMLTHIEERLSSWSVEDDWDVFTYNWSEDAAGGIGIPGLEKRNDAATHGQFLAHELKRLGYDEHVHLVAHSLGGRVIESASQALAPDPKWGGTIHETFLDAYTPSEGRRNTFGSFADWADHYYYAGRFPWITYPGDFPGTQSDLPWARNVDLTEIIEDEWNDEGGLPGNKERHKWPVAWYDITTGEGRDIDSGYGFALGKENPDNQENWEMLAEDPLRVRMTVAYPLNQKVVLPLTDPASSLPGTRVTNQRSVNPLEDVIGLSETGSVDVTEDNIGLTTGSPVWVTMLVSTEGTTDHLEFDFDFLSDAAGMLSVFLDGVQLGAFYEEFSFDGPQPSGKLFFEDLDAGAYLLAFRLDPLTDDPSSVTISNIETGYLYVVPEPSAFVLLGVGVLSFLLIIRKKRRSR